MKRLYRVTFEHELLVLADDVATAERLAERVMRLGDEDPIMSSCHEVTRKDGLDGEALRSIPWGSDDDRTVQQLIDYERASTGASPERSLHPQATSTTPSDPTE